MILKKKKKHFGKKNKKITHMAHVRMIWVVPSYPLTLQVVASRALDTFATSFAGFELDACSLSDAKTDVRHRFLFKQTWESTQLH